MILISKTLKYFIVTAQEQSIRLASIILCITPSPLCRTIKMFEMRLGHKLFVRTSNGLKLTSYGSELYATLLPLYQEVCELEGKILEKKNKNHYTAPLFKLGIDHHDYSYLSSILPSFPFKKDITLEYYSLEITSIDEVFKGGICQAFLSDRQMRCPPGVKHKLLSEEPLMLAVGKGVSCQERPTDELLVGKTLVQYEAPHIGKINYEIDAHLTANNITLERLLVPTLQAQLSMIENNEAIGFFPASVKKFIEEGHYKIKLLPFKFRKKEIVIQRHIYYLEDNGNWIEKFIAPAMAPMANMMVC